MTVVSQTSATSVSGPRRPQITLRHIWDQFWVDISGKEVQSAETYSHSWVANQFGHVCIGLILGGIATMVARLVFGFTSLVSAVGGSVLVAIVVAWWEWHAYSVAAKEATGQFPLGRKLLRRNAFIAATYLELGVATVFVYSLLGFEDISWFGQPSWVWASTISLGFLIFAIAIAIPWLRQKIIWQKAALPYVFRLADSPPVMHDDDARTIQELIDSEPPPEGPARQIVIGGPFGSGRTSLATGIGTEFAFRKASVRYVSLAKLLEFAAQPSDPHFADDRGPVNINYWRWSETQVLIVDDIGPLVSPIAHLQEFAKLLDTRLSVIREVLGACHTVWLIGEPQGSETTITAETLDQFAVSIGNFCNTEKQARVLVIQLERETTNVAAAATGAAAAAAASAVSKAAGAAAAAAVSAVNEAAGAAAAAAVSGVNGAAAVSPRIASILATQTNRPAHARVRWVDCDISK